MRQSCRDSLRRMRVRGSGGDGRGPAVAGLVGLAVVTLLLVVLAAGSGTVRPVSESTAVRTPRPFTPPPDTQTPDVTPPPLGQTDPVSLPGWLSTTIELSLLLIGVAIALLLLRALLRAGLRLLRGIRLPAAETADPASWQQVTRAELADAVETGFERLDTGRPADAIVACWLAFEQTAAAAGVVRAPSETPAELTVRVLAAHWVSRQALERLADLYREARYSVHGLPESARAEARAALVLLRAELAPVSVPDEPAPEDPGPEAP